ncbi:hypothetical protein DP187_24245 [Enterobacter cloacae]|nr:hypothetical protein DP187_24245 [Enterobacter cloacae]
MLQQEINRNVSTDPPSVSVLEHIMEYQIDDLIHKLCKEWDVTREQDLDISANLYYFWSATPTFGIHFENHDVNRF